MACCSVCVYNITHKEPCQQFFVRFANFSSLHFRTEVV
nr:MAG TPA: hypothetical protein [Caudoviricetes sp.]